MAAGGATTGLARPPTGLARLVALAALAAGLPFQSGGGPPGRGLHIPRRVPVLSTELTSLVGQTISG